MFLIYSYHGLFHLIFFFSLALLHTLKTDSSKSLSLCNLIMEETPDSGLTEEIQGSYIGLGAFAWGLDASTESVSQEITPSESREDLVCVSEAEQDTGLLTGVLPSPDWSIVAEQGEHVLGPAPGDNAQLSPKSIPGTGIAVATCMEMEQPYEFLDSEMPSMETADPLHKGHGNVKKSCEDQENQKTEDSVWAGVETCHKVDTGAFDTKVLEGIKELEEKIGESTANRAVDVKW